MRRFCVVIVSTLLFAVPAAGHTRDRPVTNREPDAVDVATTPARDLNLRSDEIPSILVEAVQDPYALSELDRCAPLIAEVNELNRVLGDDFDLPQEKGRRVSAGRVAQSVVGSFIPFRTIVREISGANQQERTMLAAIQAGLTRRGFLKGVGQSRGCRYPARPAKEKDVARLADERRRAEAEEQQRQDNRDAEGDVEFTSRPVVQDAE